MRRRYLATLALMMLAAVVGLRRFAPPPRAVASPSEPRATPQRRADPAAVRPLSLPASPRAIVFAPHPDDETIAVGGLLHRWAHAGIPLRVVFMTNGDGYPAAVKEDFDVKKPADADFVNFGDLRRHEAIGALGRLGVPRGNIRFLGFPDGGLAELWRAHWLRSHPYTSPYTGENSPPEPDGATYDGQDLTAEIAHELREFRPNVVVMPHPYDTHLDHAHTTYFVTEAMSELQARGVLSSHLSVLTYLVHYPSWPATRPPTFDRFVPATDLPDTRWTETDLTPAELAAKRAALAEYRTQLEVMNGFLHHFLCRNELFATVDGRVLERIASIH